MEDRATSVHATRSWLRAAAAGGGVWVASAALLDLDRIEILLLLAPLVLVPLGAALAAPTVPGPLVAVWRWLPPACPAAAVLLAVGLVYRPGALSLGLALPWLACTAVLAAGGAARAVVRLRSPAYHGLPGGTGSAAREARGHARLPSALVLRVVRSGVVAGLAIDAGLLFLVVGGAWTALSAAGSRPLGFAEPIVLLTGVHFHYSGFVMALLAGWLAARRGDIASNAVAVGVVVGVPLVAVGITAGGVTGLLGIELAAAAFLGAVGIALGGLQLHSAAKGPGGGGPARLRARALLGLSGLCLAVGMVLAIAYPLGRWLEEQWLDIPLMAATHGTLNAVGFGLLGLVAWMLHARVDAVASNPG